MTTPRSAPPTTPAGSVPVFLDWRDRRHWNGGRRALCRHCGRRTFLLDEHGIPAHKTCAETALTAAPAVEDDYREDLIA